MKAFLNRTKLRLIRAAVYLALVSVIVVLAVTGYSITAYEYVSTKVRGAVGWIADKYNAVVTKFKTEVSEETSKA